MGLNDEEMLSKAVEEIKIKRIWCSMKARVRWLIIRARLRNGNDKNDDKEEEDVDDFAL